MIHQRGIWLEIVTLIIPGFNDADDELRAMARFIASVSRDIPWHVTGDPSRVVGYAGVLIA